MAVPTRPPPSSGSPTATKPTVTAITLVHLARAIGLVGGDAVEVLGDDHETARSQGYEQRVPIARLIAAWEGAVAATGRRDLPAVAAACGVHDERSLLAFLIANQPTFAAALAAFIEFAPTISDGYGWQAEPAGDAIAMVVQPAGPVDLPGWQWYLEYEVLDIVCSVHRLSGGRLRCTGVELAHPAPAPAVVDAYRELLGLTPRFSTPSYRILVPRDRLELAIEGARPALAEVVHARLTLLRDAQRANGTHGLRVTAAIGRLLESGTISVGAVADAVGMSRRSLERALANEGLAASALIDEERRKRAVVWLATMTVDEVGSRLGYGDPRAFARAFKRWTGRPPRDYRR